jgi:hypothetical protein
MPFVNDDDWLRSIPSREGFRPDDLETAKLIRTHQTLPAELATSDPVERLVQLDVLEVRQTHGRDDYEYRMIVHELNARWPLQP